MLHLFWFRLCWLHWYQEIHLWLRFYASWWSCILEKCKTILDYSTYAMEFELVSCFEATLCDVCLKNFISRLRVVNSISRSLKLYCDNSAVIFMTKNKKSKSWNKHINNKYLIIRERVKEILTKTHGFVFISDFISEWG